MPKTPAALPELLASRRAMPLPAWEALPAFELYVDQVVTIVKEALSWADADGDDRSLTAAMVNNYVKQGVLPPPVKKRYEKRHLALLIILCSLKPVLDIAAIGRILPAEKDAPHVRAFYERFAACSAAAVERTSAAVASDDGPETDTLLRLALSAALCKNLANHLTPPSNEPKEKPKKEKKTRETAPKKQEKEV